MEFPAVESLRIISTALQEDIGAGDITSKYVVPEDVSFSAQIIAKDNGVLCGMKVVYQVYEALSRSVSVRSTIKDGERYKRGDILAFIDGPARTLLAGERVALNVLCRLCGIATQTALFVSALEGTGCKILDTRKTTPGLRALEKYAVFTGGGMNHRFGLWDMILIKDNHIAAAGGIDKALETVYSKGRPDVPVIVETRTLDELRIALSYPVDRILLDNFSVEEIKKAIVIRNERDSSIPFEVSGGITLENARPYAETGVEFLSCGALTHSVKSADISMIFKGER